MSLKKPAPTATRSEKEAYVKALAAISISVLALLLAVTNYFAGRNSSAVLNGTISANNLWTWYGTKNVRATIHEVAGSKDEMIRLRADMEEIEAKARAAEATRDVAKTKSPWYSYSAMALQLAIGVVWCGGGLRMIERPAHRAGLTVDQQGGQVGGTLVELLSQQVGCRGAGRMQCIA